MDGLCIFPNYIIDDIDNRMQKIRTDYPDMNDEDAVYVRQELINAIAKYGYLPEFEIEKKKTS